MTADHGSLLRAAPRFVNPREIGPVGTASRAVGGAVAIALPIALEGFGWWDVAAAVVALPLVALAVSALVTAAYRRMDPGALSRGHLICSGPACWTVAAIAGIYVAITFLTPVDGSVAFWVWIGLSLELAALRGYGGCEVLAIPNLLTGRRDQIGCIVFTPIDAAEARRTADERAGSTIARS